LDLNNALKKGGFWEIDDNGGGNAERLCARY